MEVNLSTLFSSRANYLVLECLVPRTSPSHLRELSRLTRLHIHSVENSVKDLCSKKLLRRRVKGRLALYQLNEIHPLSPLLKKIFALVQKEQIQSEAIHLSDRAVAHIEFLDSSLALVRKAKQQG